MSDSRLARPLRKPVAKRGAPKSLHRQPLSRRARQWKIAEAGRAYAQQNNKIEFDKTYALPQARLPRAWD